MGLLSNIGVKIQQAKSRGKISSMLCGRSWLVISNDERTNTYLFKPDGQLLITRDGLISPARWDFRAENDTLLITDVRGAGIAFSVNIIKEDVLISLVRLNTSDGLFLSNEGVPHSPRSFEDVDNVFVEVVVQKIKRLIEYYLNGNKDLKYYEKVMRDLESESHDSRGYLHRILNRNTPAFRNALDSLLEHVYGEMLIKIIDIARKEYVDIENEIVCIVEKRKYEEERRKEERRKEERRKEERPEIVAVNDGNDDDVALFDHSEKIRSFEPDCLFNSVFRIDYSTKIEEYVNTKH